MISNINGDCKNDVRSRRFENDEWMNAHFMGNMRILKKWIDRLFDMFYTRFGDAYPKNAEYSVVVPYLRGIETDRASAPGRASARCTVPMRN